MDSREKEIRDIASNQYNLISAVAVNHLLSIIDQLRAGGDEIMSSPSYLYKPKLSIDGNKWCALYGENLQDGVAGFGGSPHEAYKDFDKNWYEKIGKEKP